MLNFGLGEIVLVIILALVVVGPDRLPEMVRFLGRQYGKLMRASNELRQAFVLEAERAESLRRSELLKTRREQARARADAVRARARQAPKPESASASPEANEALSGESEPEPVPASDIASNEPDHESQAEIEHEGPA